MSILRSEMPPLPIKIFRVAERSMEPSIAQGSYVVVCRLIGGLKPGNVVVLRHPTKQIWIVKRIKQVSNGRAYVVGDNASQSEDSRKFGIIKTENIFGKVVLVL